jgi:hypothetical protein
VLCMSTDANRRLGMRRRYQERGHPKGHADATVCAG